MGAYTGVLRTGLSLREEKSFEGLSKGRQPTSFPGLLY